MAEASRNLFGASSPSLLCVFEPRNTNNQQQTNHKQEFDFLIKIHGEQGVGREASLIISWFRPPVSFCLLL